MICYNWSTFSLRSHVQAQEVPAEACGDVGDGAHMDHRSPCRPALCTWFTPTITATQPARPWHIPLGILKPPCCMKEISHEASPGGGTLPSDISSSIYQRAIWFSISYTTDCNQDRSFSSSLLTTGCNWSAMSSSNKNRPRNCEWGVELHFLCKRSHRGRLRILIG
jgi:hypothetical protein